MLTAGQFQDYDFNRMVVRFTMKNDEANVACAISTDAMDALEGSSGRRRRSASSIPAAARPDRNACSAKIQRSRTGGQSSRRDPARDRFPLTAD